VSPQVECTNCGPGVEVWVTVGALLIAGVALVISAREHREFMRQLRARARFRLTPRVLGANERGVIETGGSVRHVRVEIGLKNIGDRAASATVINVVAPRRLESLRWCGPKGEDVTDPALRQTAETAEVLTDVEGRRFEAEYLARELPRVGRKMDYVGWITFAVAVPPEGETSVPLRVTAQADELPDDIQEVSERVMVRVVRERR
jgi:hypothetical protein